MGGIHQNFEDLRTWDRDIRETKFDSLGSISNTLYDISEQPMDGSYPKVFKSRLWDQTKIESLLK